MNNSLNFELLNHDPETINRLLDQYLAAFERLETELAKGREEIDRINAENQMSLAQLQEQMRKAA